jgi:hypothetical protein
MHVGGGEVLTLRADRDEPIFGEQSSDVDMRLRAFNEPVLSYQGRALVRLSPEDTNAFIAILERRLELNATLLERYPDQVAALETTVAANKARVEAAYEVVAQLVIADQAETTARSQWKPADTIIPNIGVITAERWLTTQGCFLRDTDAWKRYEFVDGRAKAHTSAETHAVQELTRLRKAFVDERQLTSRIESRLYELRLNLEWWAQQSATFGDL